MRRAALLLVAAGALQVACADEPPAERDPPRFIDLTPPEWSADARVEILRSEANFALASWSTAIDREGPVHYEVFVDGRQVREAQVTTQVRLVTLRPGVEHTLEIGARDAAGNAASRRLSVTFATPESCAIRVPSAPPKVGK